MWTRIHFISKENVVVCLTLLMLTLLFKNMNFIKIKEYGDTVYNPDGSVKHYLHVWDDGHRTLVQCLKCGAYFIHQSSEYHGPEDDYYSDWYQVEDELKAVTINEVLNGWQLETKYKAPCIKRTNNKLNWNKGNV